VLLQKLGEIRARVEESLTARSPLEKYDEVEKDLREKWEDELAAAIEAEYRRQRADLLLLVQWWLRDVWLHTLAAGKDLLNFPKIAGAEAVAGRLSPRQRWKICRRWNKPSGCCTPTCRRRSRSKSVC
jgi:hypothetical protein